MFFILTSAGQALVDASPGAPIVCTSYKIASSTPYTPVTSQTAMIGSSLFTGVPALPNVQSNGSIRYTITLDPTAGDFVFNEIGLYVGATLFAVASNSSAITKLRTTGLVVGNSMALDCYVSPISGGQSFLDVSNSNVEYNVAQLGLIDNLPSALSNDINIYQVGIAGSACKSTIAFCILDKWDFADYSEVGKYTVDSGGAGYVQFATKKQRPEFEGHLILQVLSGANAGQVRTISSYIDAQNRYVFANSFNSIVEVGASVQVLAYNKINGTAIFGSGEPNSTTDTRFGRYIDDSTNPNIEYVYSVASGLWSRLGVKEYAEGIKRPKLALVGDIGATGYKSRPDANTSNVNQDNVFTWFNALAGNVFDVTGVFGSPTATAAEVNTTYLTLALASDCDYVDISAGAEDIYTVGSTSGTVLASVESIIDKVINAGKIPVWSTIPARAFVTEPKLAEHLKLNHGMRELAKRKTPSMFWDAFAVSVDYKDAQCAAFTEFTSNGTRLNNVGSYYLAKSKLSALDNYIPATTKASVSAESYARVGNNNVLVNPGFTGTTGTLGANVVGTVPTGWKVQWVTRTGTGIARSTLVDVMDPSTGIYNATGVSITLDSGVTSSDDSVQLVQDTGISASLTGGMYVSSEANVLAYSVSGTSKISVATVVNGYSSTWGSSVVAANTYVDSLAIRAKTLPTQVSGTGAPSTASMSASITVNGPSTFSIVISAPMLKQSSNYLYPSN